MQCIQIQMYFTIKTLLKLYQGASFKVIFRYLTKKNIANDSEQKNVTFIGNVNKTI